MSTTARLTGVLTLVFALRAALPATDFATAAERSNVVLMFEDVPAGKYRALVVVEPMPVPSVQQPSGSPLNLIPLTLEGWPSDSTFRREELYGDDGR